MSKSYKCWAYEEIGHYANEYKNKKTNKLIKTLGSLNYLEIWEEEALDLALKNKEIVEIVMEDEYKSNYEKTSHMMESNSISLSNLQREEFTVDNKN